MGLFIKKPLEALQAEANQTGSKSLKRVLGPWSLVAVSAYTYSYATMGELIAWIIGWDLVLEYTVAATTVSISWSRYLVVFLEGLGINLPTAFTACPWDGGIVNGRKFYL